MYIVVALEIQLDVTYERRYLYTRTGRTEKQQSTQAYLSNSSGIGCPSADSTMLLVRR